MRRLQRHPPPPPPEQDVLPVVITQRNRMKLDRLLGWGSDCNRTEGDVLDNLDQKAAQKRDWKRQASVSPACLLLEPPPRRALTSP